MMIYKVRINSLDFVWLLFLIATFQSFSLQAQRLGFALTDNLKKVEIPFELYNNLVVVSVKVNDQLPLKFIIDTGVRTAILTNKVYSDFLNLKYTKKFTISGHGEQRYIDAYITNNVSLGLEGVVGRGHAMLVLAEDYLQLRNYLGADVHGILGYELFSRFIVAIDYDKKILTLYEPSAFKIKRRYRKLPMPINDTKPYIEASVFYSAAETHKLKLMVDTGASHGLRIESDSDAQLYIPEPSIEAVVGRGLAGVMHGKMARLKGFQLSDMFMKDVIASFPQEYDVLDSLEKGVAVRNGSIGGEVLSRFKVVFNFPEEEMYLKPNRKFKARFYYNMSGLTIKAGGHYLNKFEIIEVRPHSVADEHGLMKGDQIISINHFKVENLKLGEIMNYLNGKENKKIRMVVMRGNVRITTKFALKSSI